MKFVSFVILANLAALVSGAPAGPTEFPTLSPTALPTVSSPPTVEPSVKPTVVPTVEPSVKPTVLPSIAPSAAPTVLPTLAPTVLPTLSPTLAPTLLPTLQPTVLPTIAPTVVPTFLPTIAPTVLPTLSPTVQPTVTPTLSPTVAPTIVPTITPTVIPTLAPTVTPTVVPTIKPTVLPTIVPTLAPTVVPTIHPTITPTVQPSEAPTQPPSHHPTISGPGWFTESYYANDSSTDPVVVYGTRTQTCQSAYSGFGLDFFYKYSCGDGYLQFQQYSDAACTEELNDAEVSFDFEWEFEGIPFNFHRGNEFIREWYMLLTTARFECVDDANLYSFAENQKYAVTEYYPTDGTENDEAEQCDVDYTQFAAYQKGYCFNIYKHYEQIESWEFDYMGYYKFSSSDDTFISLTAFYSPECSYANDYFYVLNIFPVDECEANFYEGYFGPAVASKQVEDTKPQKREIKNLAMSPFKFDSSTPTALKSIMSDSLAKKQNKPYVDLGKQIREHNKKAQAQLEAKHPKKAAAMKKASAAKKAAAGKKNLGVPINNNNGEGENDDGYYQEHPESGNVYFTDDYSDDDYTWDTTFTDSTDTTDTTDTTDSTDTTESNGNDDWIPKAPRAQWLSEYYQWKNVPALSEGAPAPASWFTEVVYSDEVPTLVSTRHTLQCMPYTRYSDFSNSIYINFNYAVVCENGYLHTLYYEWYDVTCQGDYVIQSREYSDFFNLEDGFGKKEYDTDDVTFECSNVMFSSVFTESIGENSYATEFFYPMASYNPEDDDYTAVECPVASEDTTEVTMGVAILQDWCFTIYSEWNDDYFSAKYWVDEEDNNQNIQFTVWQAAQCSNKFVTQTKEIEINHCYDEQPNSVYQTDNLYGNSAKTKDAKSQSSQQDILQASKSLMDFEKHDTMKTPFNLILEERLPKKMRARQQKAMKEEHKTKKQEATDKTVAEFDDDYYYYYDQANSFFNNRVTYTKNQWFTIPTSPTIPPSEVPTVSPTEGPTVVPSEIPTIAPTQPPTEIPTIEPTMAPNPPTLRPTPAAGMPTASPTHQVTYTFTVEQNLKGIDKATFDANPHNGVAFEEAVAMALPPLTADNVEITDVTDVVVEARRLRGLYIDGAEVDITYVVSYTVAETGYNDAETAFAALNASLYTAVVETDLFDGYISVVAAEDSEDAPDLLGTTSHFYTSYVPDQVGTDDDSKPNTDNHHKIIVGVLVGLGGGLLLICIIAFCIFGLGRRGESSDAQSYSNPQSVPQPVPVEVNEPKVVELSEVDPAIDKSGAL